MKSFIKGALVAAAVVALSSQSVLAAASGECASGVSSAMDQQRQKYIAANADLAQQNFSKRPGSFASTTCLDNLMSSGGLDIFFKPPSLDNILNMVKNLACEQATQIFDSLLSGSGLNGASLQPGEIMSGINLGGNLLSSISSSSSSGSSSGGVSGLINSLIGSGTSGSSSGTTNVVESSLRSVFQ
jgi:hypothetical protein